MENNKLSDVNSKSGSELIAIAHGIAANFESPATELLRELASRLECSIIRGDELQQKLDAMAAEMALNGWVACSPEWIDKNGPCSCEAAPRIAFGNIGPHYHPQSFNPATDAYLNSVRAEGVAMFAEELGSPYGDYDNRDYETGFNRAIEVSKSKAVKFANQLRSGTHDTADKAG